MDIAIGVLFAALVIGLSTIAGRSLDRARRRADEEDRKNAKSDADLYGDF